MKRYETGKRASVKEQEKIAMRLKAVVPSGESYQLANVSKLGNKKTYTYLFIVGAMLMGKITEATGQTEIRCQFEKMIGTEEAVNFIASLKAEYK